MISKITKYRFVLVLSCFFSASLVFSQVQDYEKLLDDAAEALYFDEDYSLAASLLEKAVKIKEDSKVYNDLGRAYSHLNKPREAAECYVKAALTNDTLAVNAFLNAIITLEASGLYDDATTVYNQAFQWHRECPYWYNSMRTIYVRRTNYYIHNHSVPEALNLSLEQLELMDSKGVTPQTKSRNDVLAEIAQFASYSGDSKTLLRHGATLAGILESVPYNQRHSNALSISLLKPVADYYVMTGEYSRADSVWQALVKVNTGPEFHADNLTGYAVFLSKMGRSRRAMEVWDDAINLYMQSKLYSNAALANINKANLAIQLKDWNALKVACAKVVDLMQLIENDARVGEGMRYTIAYQLAQLMTRANYYDSAEELYLSILPYFQEKNQSLQCAIIYSGLGVIKDKAGQYIEALEYYNKVNELLDVENYREDAISNFNNIAGVLHKLGNDEETVKIYSAILEVLRSIVDHDFVYMTDDERHDFWNNYYYVFDNIHGLPSSVPDIGKLRYDAALFNKGILLDASARLQTIILNSPDSELKKDFMRLREMRSISDNVHFVDSIKVLERDIQNRVLALESFTAGSKVYLSGVSSQLGPDDFAVEIVRHVSDDGLYHYEALITNSKGEVIIEPLPSQSQVEALDQNKIYTEPEALATKFWEPILRHCHDFGTIYISPDGIYHRIAFEHLPYGGVPVSRTGNIVRVSSTRLLAASGKQLRDGDLSLWGGFDFNNEDDSDDIFDTAPSYSSPLRLQAGMEPWSYLPGTANEINSLETLASESGMKVTTFTDDQGTESVFKLLSGKSPGILHIATHGFYIPSTEETAHADMLRAGLALSGANQQWRSGFTIRDGINDGILTAAEISRLDLSATNLVVLSACQSGLGDIEAEGVFGLPRAFKQSGVGSIIMTLWPVADEPTSRIMSSLYRGILSGKSIRQSLAEACAAEGGDDPSIWAAFVVLD